MQLSDCLMRTERMIGEYKIGMLKQTVKDKVSCKMNISIEDK